MKAYHGFRTTQGPIVHIVVDGHILGDLPHLVRHSPTGFEWGYGGSGPADLAYALLADAVDTATADQLYQDFKWAFVAHFADTWTLSTHAIHTWVATVSHASRS
ncbi:hypothetical protein SAMN00768000_3543 [Sulfobacillus thermosulfidooxidans DSM 9293]|uniref:Uncharacterized protein n=1 Tax=Sulfobacillus thermosulfidooxidans (strain DSM 9293 / VKM B-1269 / AT-1) TaxID=929705 RepID=A0A1W1WNZ0_SULTA|nr:DUF6166 domain-containing protein [Sulfobacillus thermosulfidooxidans]SMC07946.1 hypothetical protein SAMN00768000_3543 [Sulfobacillus thermosulfidooxidans DSM 9293]